MGRVTLLGDRPQNPHVVSIQASDGASAQTTATGVPLDLGSSALLRLADAALANGLGVVSLRIEDAARLDCPELDGLKEYVLTALRAGGWMDAMGLLLDWPGDVFVSGLVLRDPDLKLRFAVNRNGTIDVPDAEVADLIARLQSFATARPAIFAT